MRSGSSAREGSLLVSGSEPMRCQRTSERLREREARMLFGKIFRSSDREKYIMESLILAQNERWRRVLSMQVERQAQQCA
jgi:hypothetical protein